MNNSQRLPTNGQQPTTTSQQPMANGQRLTAILLLLVALGGIMRVNVSAQVADRFARIDALLAEEMAAHRFPGVALAITQGEEIVHQVSFGVAGAGEAITPQTPFFIGSVTKSFTALAVMQLVEAGQLELDAPVQRYLPWFAVADAEASAQITVRHLLNQTSGLSENTYARTQLPATASIEEGVGDLRNARSFTAPGEKYQYFNPNYNILGLLVEEVSGMSYAAYLQEKIFHPLGMRNSFVAGASAGHPRIAQGHNVFFGFPFAQKADISHFDAPAGYVVSSAEDMARYVMAINNGGRLGDVQILSSAGIAAMQGPSGVADSPYTMGWLLADWHGAPVITHNGAVATSFASVALLPEQGYGVVLFINQVGILHMLTVYDRLAQSIVAILVEQPPQTFFPLRFVYLFVGLLAMVDISRRIYVINRLPRWWQRNRQCTPRQLLPPILWQLIYPILLVVGLPLFVISQIGVMGLRILVVHFLPDISLWILASVGLALVEALRKLSMIYESRRGVEREVGNVVRSACTS
jgi:CubicO group peptidase (beta-lactamase class C family)